MRGEHTSPEVGYSWKEDSEAPEQGLVSDPFSVGTERRTDLGENKKAGEAGPGT